MPLDQIKTDVATEIASTKTVITNEEIKSLIFIQAHYCWFILGAFVLGVIAGLVL